MKNFFIKFRFKKKIFFIFIFFLLEIQASNANIIDSYLKFKDKKEKLLKNNGNTLISDIYWEKVKEDKNISIEGIRWEYFEGKNSKNRFIPHSKNKYFENSEVYNKLGSLNRSIVFDNRVVGPDISWIVPIGFKWNNKNKFDFTVRGHNTRIPEPQKRNFFGWNDGDAVGLLSYQFLNFEKSSFGINLGIRSVYQGTGAAGGGTSFGEGISSGFRWDYALSETSGLAFGAEQLIHFDGLTDTGRNIYLTVSKGWWSTEYNDINNFPLYIATAGLGTGRMAVGSVKGLCGDILGGSGTEIKHKRNLCWAPIFSLARVWNEKYSTFFEYNSRFFLLGSSFSPIQNIPARGTFALILSDHVDNYSFHDFSEINWVFNISIGF
tara:strand:- start:405 stop:1541 length:1137 start_codon:yes stop_codon:yes gene_type:complete